MTRPALSIAWRTGRKLGFRSFALAFRLGPRLPKHDIAADVRVANYHRTATLIVHNPALGNRDGAVRLRTCVSCVDVARLQTGIAGVDVLKLHGRRCLALIHREIAELDAQ